jgi:hypothetical protein
MRVPRARATALAIAAADRALRRLADAERLGVLGPSPKEAG